MLFRQRRISIRVPPSGEEHADSPAAKRHGTEGFDRSIHHAFHDRDHARRQPTGIVDFLAGPQGRGLDCARRPGAFAFVHARLPAGGGARAGCTIEDVDGNLFLDFTAGIAVTATGHCHPEVTAAIIDQAGKLVHMSGTDFYYTPEIELAERLARLAPAPSEARLLH